MSILAASLKLGDEVITTPMTFCATVSEEGAPDSIALILELKLNVH
ncbi:hypothetical protein QUB63_08000 [Microcoleus sp. ARI1-B5]